MTSIYDKIAEKRQKDIDNAVEARGKKIHELRDKVIELLKTGDISVGDAQIVLKTVAEKIQIASMEKSLGEYV